MNHKSSTKEVFQDKRAFYENEISKIEEKYEKQWLPNLKIRKEKLEKWKNLLDTLSWLIDKRSKKADEIRSLINTWKDISSEIDNINDVNNKIKDTQGSLLLLEPSKWISTNITNILWENISSDIISKVLNTFNKELNKVNTEIEKKEEEKALLNQKYKQYISYIDKYLSNSKYDNSKYTTQILKSDLVYQYAKKKWMENILERIKERKLTYKEYENLLIEINPTYAYIVHMVDISQSETEKQKYYWILINFEKWTISEKDKIDIENKCNERLDYRNNWKQIFSSTEEEKDFTEEEKDFTEEEVSSTNEEEKKLEEFIKEIPHKIERNSKFTPEQKQKKVLNILWETEWENNLRLLAKALMKQWWKLVVDKHIKFSFLRKEQNNKKTELETWWYFTNKDDYENFKWKNDHNSKEALDLINSNHIDFIISHLEYFKNLNEEVLNKLSENINNHNKLLKNYNSFWIDINKFLMILLDNQLDWNKIKTLLPKRNDLNWDLACKLVYYDLEYLEELIEDWWFLKLNSKTASVIMKTSKDWKIFVMSHPYYFENLNLKKDDIENQIQNLIKNLEYKTAIDILKNNQWIDHQKFAVILAEKDITNKDGETGCEAIAYHINEIKWLNHNEIAKILINLQWSEFLCDYLENFKWLDKDIAETFIKQGLWEYVAKNIRSFKWKYHQFIANKIIESKKWKCAEEDDPWNWITKNINNFEWISHLEIAKKLIKVNQWTYITPEKFHWLDYEIFEYLLGKSSGNMRWRIAKNIKNFESRYHKTIANKLIEIGKWKFVAQFIRNFKWLDTKDKIKIANAVLDSEDHKYIEKYLDNFEFNKEIEDKIIEKMDITASSEK